MPSRCRIPSARVPRWCLAALLALPLSAAAQDAPEETRAVSPALNAYYHDADVERWRMVFESPGREIFDKRFQIVQATGVRPGASVADIGAGTGLFTMLFARAVGPSGKVYAVDISPSFGESIARRAGAYHVDNVEAIVNDQKDTRLAPDSVDLAFVCDTYHHFEYPRAMLDSIAAALREHGELVVIDFRRDREINGSWIMEHVRAGKDEVIAEIRAAGFELVEERDFLRRNYFLRFRKA